MGEGKKRANESEKISKTRRDLLKASAAAAAIAGSATAMGNAAYADSFKEEANRYIPPGQWPHHLGLEWYELPSEDPKVIEVWGYTDKFSYRPGEEVAFHVSTGAPTFDIKIYRDGGKFEEVHSADKLKGKRSSTSKDAYSVGCS